MKKGLISCLLLLVMSGCGTVDKADKSIDVKNIECKVGYVYVEIEEMPCFIVSRVTDNLLVWNYVGITCDWSKRK